MFIDGKYAQLQKLSSNFQSCRYRVNLTNLYPASNNSGLEFRIRSIDSDSSSESEKEITNITPAQTESSNSHHQVCRRDIHHTSSLITQTLIWNAFFDALIDSVNNHHGLEVVITS